MRRIREKKINKRRLYMKRYRAAQSEEDRTARSQQKRQHDIESRRSYKGSMADFMQAINTFCEKICEICTKRCYPHQISKWTINSKTAPYLPNELKQRNGLVVCNRCKTHLSSKKNIAPAKSHWNHLDPGSIPEVIANLSQAEQRLISRIIPFVKIIKLSGVFGQYGFRGQAVLFAQDVYEVTENLSNMLPRTSNNAGIVVVTERLENINVTRQFSISRQNVYNAPYWLVANNPLYKDVTIDQNVVINEGDIIRAKEAPAEIAEETNDEATEDTSAYMRINDCSRIVRASWHQANDSIFISGFSGVQCCAMVLANILRAYILSPQHWSTNDLNLNMISSDQIYRDVRFQTERNFVAYPIDKNGYLLVRNFKVIKNDLVAFNKRFQINFDEEPRIYGNLNDQVNQANFGRTLRQGIDKLFEDHNAGILISEGRSFGVMRYDNKYYFSDSHSCDPKGANAKDSGKACIIECDNVDEFVRICKRTTEPETQTRQNTERVVTQTIASRQKPTHQIIPLQTSVMAPIDVMQPNVEDELQVSRNLNEITRKTTDNIVNVGHELKAEELAWYFLFPYGKNRLEEQSQDGAVEDVHLYVKSLRSSAAYWRSALNELLAQIRCLGPPTYFLTFSSNDLNWLDQ
ncbi:ATP-dependent DNA helicase [Trichonephila clavata]|uniref:ATP-dependent DNA helicase n=1 Tax=Trichonephila clavata TaxID=2740835 RepID=A0A8X6GQI5_TRICU|nr:ATP-dependent DNA helicase [Trichonephila clavata]